MQLDLFSALPYNAGTSKRRCRECDCLKPESGFYIAYYKKGGEPTRGYVCSDCKKSQATLRKGLRQSAGTPPSKCECCGSEDTLLIDHCHDSLDFRGWLCNSCNVGIGHLGDNIEGLEKALSYLRKQDGRQRSRTPKETHTHTSQD